MVVVIRHLSEPYAGREITIDSAQEQIRFGRDAGADVGFPIELDIVSRDHFRLRREVGAYKFVISKDHPVFTRGRAIMDGEELEKVVELQLSGPSGPRLRIERLDSPASNVPKTRLLKGGQDIGDFARTTRSGTRRMATWLGAVTLVLAAVAGGVYLLRQDVSAVRAEIPSLQDQIAAANAAIDDQIDAAAIVARTKESIYLVQFRLPSGVVYGTGTASVVLLPDGTKALATNSHIADDVLKIASDPALAGNSAFVVQPKAPDYPTLRVVGALKHPAYDLFEAWRAKLGAMINARAAQQVDVFNSYDVALLYVEEPDKLGASLEYATRAEMEALKTGEPLLSVGYPAEGLIGTDEKRPEPTAHTGMITSLTTFYLYSGAAADNTLVQHSVPSAGGASGSPIFNAKGRVVALHNAGNVAGVAESGTRIGSAALVNYGQRADLLLDMLDGVADAELPEYRRQMAEAENRYTKTPQAYLDEIVSIFAAFIVGDPGGVQEIARSRIALNQKLSTPANGLYGAIEIELPEPAYYMVVAMVEDRRPIGLLGLDPIGAIFAAGPEGSYVSHMIIDNREGKYPRFVAGVVDQSSFGANAVTPGEATLILFKGAPPTAARGS